MNLMGRIGSTSARSTHEIARQRRLERDQEEAEQAHAARRRPEVVAIGDSVDLACDVLPTMGPPALSALAFRALYRDDTAQEFLGRALAFRREHPDDESFSFPHPREDGIIARAKGTVLRALGFGTVLHANEYGGISESIALRLSEDFGQLSLRDTGKAASELLGHIERMPLRARIQTMLDIRRAVYKRHFVAPEPVGELMLHFAGDLPDSKAARVLRFAALQAVKSRYSSEYSARLIAHVRLLVRDAPLDDNLGRLAGTLADEGPASIAFFSTLVQRLSTAAGYERTAVLRLSEFREGLAMNTLDGNKLETLCIVAALLRRMKAETSSHGEIAAFREYLHHCARELYLAFATPIPNLDNRRVRAPMRQITYALQPLTEEFARLSQACLAAFPEPQPFVRKANGSAL